MEMIMKLGKEKLTLKECCELAKEDGIYQYRKAGNCFFEKGYYIRGRSFSPQEGCPGHFDVYYLGDNFKIELLCHNATRHRALILINALQSGRINSVDFSVYNNYATNGYTTRRGLFANYNSKLEKIKKIERSHVDYLGCETGNSQLDHVRRVQIRNN